MSSILDALKKASRERPEQRAGIRLLFQESPYDRRTVGWERRQATLRRRRKWFFIALGGAALAMLALIPFLRGAETKDATPEAVAQAGGVGISIPDEPPGSPDGPPGAASSAAALYVQGEDLPRPAPIHPSEASSGAYYLIPAPSGLSVPPLMEEPVPVSEIPSIHLPAARPTPGPPASGPPAPTKPPDPPKPKAPAFQLQGIVWDDQAPMAMINQISVRVGDAIGDATVKEIGRESVVLDHNGKTVTLKAK